MNQNSLFPLRTIVGDAIPIEQKSILQTFESAESKNLGIEYITMVTSIGGTEAADQAYYRFLPTYNIRGTVLTPGEGMDTLPRPPTWLPFGNDDPLIRFFAMAENEAAGDVSRKLSARFKIHLSEPHLVGGICFGGLPYLPSMRWPMQDAGVNSSNCGLPREIRLACTGATTSDERAPSIPLPYYLDAEISATRQEIVSHAGFHFLCIDPTLTDTLSVHFSDYPEILKEIQILREGVGDGQFDRERATERYGFAIPYFYVFTYKEKTRYRPTVKGGVLGATSTHIINSYAPPLPIRPPQVSTYLNDYRYVVSRGRRGNYYDFTAASVFGQQRKYVVRKKFYEGKTPSDKKIKEQLTECFISPEIPSQKNVVLYLAQAEDYERCVAGLRMLLPFVPEVSLAEDMVQLAEAYAEFQSGIGNLIPDLARLIDNSSREELEKYLRELLSIPKDINFCEKVGLRVFEIDPLDGVSPAHVPLDSKYATLLAEMEVDDLREIGLELFLRGVRFVRPSNAKYFALELTNLDDEPGQFVVKGLLLAQSAHVSIHPRAAKTQEVKTLNFRIVGPSLAEDYAFLGTEGFNFSIERFVAGERKSVLFCANSLLDLLRTGAVKIFSNVRRRAVEFEKSEVYPAYDPPINYDVPAALTPKYLIPGEYTYSYGPMFAQNYEVRHSDARMEGWRRSETGSGVADKANRNWVTPRKQPGDFANFSNQEIRNHTKHIYPRLRDENNERTPYSYMRKWFNGLREHMLATGIHDVDLIQSPGDNPLTNNFDFWKGIDVPAIHGLKQLVASPYGLMQVSKLQAFFEDPTIDKLIQLWANHNNPATIPLTGGINSSISSTISASVVVASESVGTSFGCNVFPTLSHQATFGDQGSITKQASKTGYAYSEFLNNSYDEGNSQTQIHGGEMKRVITRREVPDTDRQRVKGAEVMWQGEVVDIITGSIPLNFTLPATAGKMHFRTADDSLRVRFGSGVGKSTSVDFWFDINEEIVKDDY